MKNLTHLTFDYADEPSKRGGGSYLPVVVSDSAGARLVIYLSLN
jgi:hypothetical protein